MSKYESIIITNPKINNKDLEKIINSEKGLIDKIEQFYKNENNIMKFIIMKTED